MDSYQIVRIIKISGYTIMLGTLGLGFLFMYLAGQ